MSDYPKWVPVHPSHVEVRKAYEGAPEHVSTPAFEQSHRNRVTGEVTALVHDEAGEAAAAAEYKAPESDADRAKREADDEAGEAQRLADEQAAADRAASKKDA